MTYIPLQFQANINVEPQIDVSRVSKWAALEKSKVNCTKLDFNLPKQHMSRPSFKRRRPCGY